MLRWKEFFDRASWGAVLTSADGTILKVNAAYARMHGYEPNELEGRPFAQLVPEALRAELPAILARVDALEHDLFECERERKDGTHFLAVLDTTAVRGEGGRLSHYVSYLQDVSPHKAAEQAQARLAAIVDSSGDAILSSDLNAMFLSANAAAERMFGYSAEELIGRPATMILPPEQSGEVARHLERLRRGEHVVGFECVRMRRDGTRFPASITLSPVRDRDGRITIISSVVRDISVLKDLERQREEWASLVAHDLRQPLGAIGLHAQVALRRFERNEPLAIQHGMESLRRIVAATQRLDRMVSDLSDVSQVDANRLRIDVREVDLGAVVQELLARAAPMLTSAERTVTVETRGKPRRVSVDPARIEQVLDNLLSNALKYGDRGTEIGIAIEWRDADVEISVTNRGAGISSDDLGRIFGRFQRAGAVRSSQVHGLGLGLYISLGLVEAHGGHLWVESTPKETTTFHVDLPAPQIARETRMTS
jgi:PAS domain S-box-containing protein